MAKQSHDLGVSKRRLSQRPAHKHRVAWSRIKRRHPGPLPNVLKDFNLWLKAGRPKHVHEKGEQ